MTETRFTWKWLFVVAALGLIGGVVLGLIIGWVFPISASSVDVSALSASAQNDYIVLVANSYAYDTDLDLARQRLTLLKDSNLKSRVERLAKSLSAKKDPDAANVADLAVGLGSTDSALKVLAASLVNSADSSGEPTKVAHVQVDSTATPKPTVAATSTLAATATAELTATPAATAKPKTAAPKSTNVPKPVATNPPAPAAALYPDFKPGYPTGWYSGTKFVPAQVSAGQQYWRLKSAQFCDVPPAGAPSDTDTCPGMPGGPMDHTIYIAVQDANGNCADNVTVKHLTNTGDTTPAEKKNVLYPWNSCQTVDYEWNMYGEGSSIWIDGLPSDRMDGMVMNSPQLNWSSNKAHVRYFLIFQLTTR